MATSTEDHALPSQSSEQCLCESESTRGVFHVPESSIGAGPLTKHGSHYPESSATDSTRSLKAKGGADAGLTVYVMRHAMRGFKSNFRAKLLESASDSSEAYEGEHALTEALDRAGPFDAIYTSPYIRTMQTAHTYATKCRLPLNADYRLVERIDPADYDPKRPEDISFTLTSSERLEYNVCDHIGGTELILMLESLARSPKGKEEKESIKRRIKDFMDEVCNDSFRNQGPRKILVVTHQSAFRALVGYALADQEGKDTFDEWSVKPNMGSLYHVTLGSGTTPLIERDFDGFSGVTQTTKALTSAMGDGYRQISQTLSRTFSSISTNSRTSRTFSSASNASRRS
eukprot:TRINITY_DN65492_c0_g1_i1.p1 TRINITY_DN65492_c0_g1~~TRINITY_DN65492_c0_g1_i1.p1  ORF type:complete len:356 (+),score=30.06 TRINITY_DN65492_c0_g1_i1:37-1068(+)